MENVETLLSKEQEELLIAAIQAAEAKTSGEIRVHLENYCRKNVLERASEVFLKLNMHQTVQRNGVLIYLAVKDHKFAIIGDIGIDKVVPEHFWEKTRDIMEASFKEGDFVGGLTGGIACAAEQLQVYFPKGDEDTNQLPDDISINRN